MFVPCDAKIQMETITSSLGTRGETMSTFIQQH